MRGSKQSAKRDWRRGRGSASMRSEIKYSLKRNKNHLNRKVRHRKELPGRCAYKKLAKDKAWEYVT